jgi:hypothetical protein
VRRDLRRRLDRLEAESRRAGAAGRPDPAILYDPGQPLPPPPEGMTMAIYLSRRNPDLDPGPGPADGRGP